MSANIRPMTMMDLNSVHEIDKNAFTMPWPKKSYHYELTQNKSSYLWVAEKKVPPAELEIIGMICVWIIVDEIHIATIAVDINFRRQGIAKRLLANALYYAYNLGATSSYLEVRQSNIAAQNLYKKFGFEIVGRRARYYNDNHEDALLMNLSVIDPELVEMYL